MSPNPHAVLGLKENASRAEINRAFRKLAKKFHPDLNQGDKAAEEKFKTLTAAYDELTAKTPPPAPASPTPRYDFQYLSELEERVRAQRVQTRKPENVLSFISSFFKNRFKA